MGRGNSVVVSGLLVLCMGLDSMLWAVVILLRLMVCLCYSCAQVLCYRQRYFCCVLVVCLCYALDQILAMDGGSFVVVGGFPLLFMGLNCLLGVKVILLVCVLFVLCIALDLICLFRI